MDVFCQVTTLFEHTYFVKDSKYISILAHDVFKMTIAHVFFLIY